MKRAILTIGLFSMMMVLTSFNTAENYVQIDNLKSISSELKQRQQEPLSNGFEFDHRGGQQVPPGKGLDFTTGGNGQQVPPSKGLDFSTGGNGQQVPPSKGL